MPLIKPELPGGFKDYLPDEQMKRVQIVRIVEEVYQRFGFLPLDTPEVERWSVLTGNEPTDMRIYRVGLTDNLSQTEESLALRFDLTVPLARVVAAYGKDLPKPFKRYQLGRVFRGEASQRGRFNGFYQFDIDTVYSSSMLADAEVIAVIWSTFNALGIENISIKINDRKILNGLAEIVGAKEKAANMFRTLDKLEKIGFDGIATELRRQPDNEYDDTALAFNPDQINLVRDFLALAGSDDPLVAVNDLFQGRTEIGMSGIEELRQVVRLVAEMAIPSERVAVDLSVARGLGYYTGPVFETVLLDLPSIGSVFSGGRFDGLVGRFSTTSVPATGASVGVDRLFTALEELRLLDRFAQNVTQVLITVFDPEYMADYLRLATELRQDKISTEIYLGNERDLKAQIGYALKQGIPLLIIAGPEELQTGSWQVKDLRLREQKSIPRDKIVSYIQSIQIAGL